MAQGIRVGVIGAGWPGLRHAEGYQSSGGFEIAAVSDLIPSRRAAFLKQFNVQREFAGYEELLGDAAIEAVSVCLPNHLHAPAVLAALKAGKHVVCETPPALTAAEAKKIAAASAKSGKIVLYAFQRRFGGNEQASQQVVSKGYLGEVSHVRASWMRTRGVPTGTGWYTDQSKSGGGAMLDLGLPMLDLAWSFLGQPQPIGVFAHTGRRLSGSNESAAFDVEDIGFALLRFEGGKSLELAASWAINQPPQMQGTLCRVHGDKGALEVYRSDGPALYQKFGVNHEPKETVLKLPKLIHHAALMRHFRQCIQGQATPIIGPADGLKLMQMMDAIYKSAVTGRSVELKPMPTTQPAVTPPSPPTPDD